MTAFPASTWARPARRRTGVLGLGLLALAASAWLLAPQTLASFGPAAIIDAGDVLQIAISSTVPASLVLALGAVSTRVVWLLVLAIPVLAIHGLLLVVTAIVVGADGASGLVVLARLGDALAIGLALVGVVIGLVATLAARAGDRREGAGWVAAIVLAGIAAAIVVATPYVAIGSTGALRVLLSHTTLVVLLLVVAGIAGIQSATARWIAAGLAVLTAVWIVAAETVLVPSAAAATVAISVIRAVLVLLAAALIALSTRWLTRPHGVAPPVAPPAGPSAQPHQVAPPVVPDRGSAPVATPPQQSPHASQTTAPPRTAHAPGVPADVDAAIDQSDQEVPTQAPAPFDDDARGAPGEGDSR